MFFVYVLQDKNGKLYKGQTSDLARRFSEHINGHTKSTKNLNEPKIIYTEEFERRGDAVSREKYLKSAAGRKFLKKYCGRSSTVEHSPVTGEAVGSAPIARA